MMATRRTRPGDDDDEDDDDEDDADDADADADDDADDDDDEAETTHERHERQEGTLLGTRGTLSRGRRPNPTLTRRPDPPEEGERIAIAMTRKFQQIANITILWWETGRFRRTPLRKRAVN